MFLADDDVGGGAGTGSASATMTRTAAAASSTRGSTPRAPPARGTPPTGSEAAEAALPETLRTR
jgi:hypothetical protein